MQIRTKQAAFIAIAATVVVWACDPRDVMLDAGGAMLDAAAMLDGASGDAAAQEARNLSCEPSGPYRTEMRADRSVWQERTTYWVEIHDPSITPSTRVHATLCDSTAAVAPGPCPTGFACSGDPPPATPSCQTGNVQVKIEDGRLLIYCGATTRNQPASGPLTVSGNYFTTAHVSY